MDDGISFEEAIEKNDVARIKYLLKRRFLLFRRVNPNDWTHSNFGPPILDAADRGHLEIVKVLVGAGADVNEGKVGYSAIHAAAANGHLEVVRFLAKNGASTGQDGDGSTPLHYAQRAGHQEVVDFLTQSRQQ